MARWRLRFLSTMHHKLTMATRWRQHMLNRTSLFTNCFREICYNIHATLQKMPQNHNFCYNISLKRKMIARNLKIQARKKVRSSRAKQKTEQRYRSYCRRTVGWGRIHRNITRNFYMTTYFPQSFGRYQSISIMVTAKLHIMATMCPLLCSVSRLAGRHRDHLRTIWLQFSFKSVLKKGHSSNYKTTVKPG